MTILGVRGSAAAALLTLGTLAACQAGPAAQPPVGDPEPSSASAFPDRVVLDDEAITESSGLAAGVRHPGVLYTHNDRGADPEIFAVAGDGTTRAVLTLRGVSAVDWEDIATTSDGRIWVGDIGDQDGTRPTITVYVVAEPRRLVDAEVAAQAFELRFPDGPHNAEGMMVNPVTDRVYIVTKGEDGGAIYAAPLPLTTSEPNLLEQVAPAPPNITAASYDPDATGFALRNYARAFVYDQLGKDPTVVELPKGGQGESLVLERGSGALLVGSEGAGSTVERIPVLAAPTSPS